MQNKMMTLFILILFSVQNQPQQKDGTFVVEKHRDAAADSEERTHTLIKGAT